MPDTVWALVWETWRQIPSRASQSEGDEIGFHFLILIFTVFVAL